MNVFNAFKKCFNCNCYNRLTHNLVQNCHSKRANYLVTKTLVKMSTIDGQLNDQIVDKSLLKSTNDKLNYKYIVLTNGLKALLVSDPTYANITDNTNDSNASDLSDSEGNTSDELTDVSSDCDDKSESNEQEMSQRLNLKKKPNDKFSAVAIVVRTGSFANPKEMQGLAHLVEHVLTMGSKEFPEENDLDDYLTSRGGYQNAHTEYEYTMYEVEVQKKHLYGALKRLAHCFIHPLLRSESIDREVKPVDIEYNSALPDDDVRLEQIFNNLANEEHPFNQFAWGNKLSLKTLPEQNGIETQKYVKEFVEKYYHSDNIHLVIQSQEALETIEQWITDLFGQIKPLVRNNEISKEVSNETKFGKPFDNNLNYNKLFIVEPVNEADQIALYWWLPPVTQHYKSSPLHYLGNIVGHEGKGSLISFLRKENLALELVGGIDDSGFSNNKYSSVFQIVIKLTELGNEKIDKVIEYIFEYLNVLQKEGPKEWFFKEMKRIEKNGFNWQEEHTAIDYVKKLANNLKTYPIEYVLCGNKFFEYDGQLIQSYLNLLTPNNAQFVRLLTNVFKDKKDVQIEKWFGTKYTVNDVPKKWLEFKSKDVLTNRFHFPIPNPYIATDFEIKKVNLSDKTLHPTKVLNKSRVKLWYKSDDKFKLPKAIMKLHLISSNFLESIESAIMMDLFVEILVQILSEEVYDATLAGLYYSIRQTTVGLVVTVAGFNDKLSLLLDTILDKMINFKVDNRVFNDVKTHVGKEYHNNFIDANNLNLSLRLSVLSQKFYNAVDRRTVLNAIDEQSLQSFVSKYFSNFYIESLIEGNFTKDESIDLMTKIENKLGLDRHSDNLEEPKLTTAQIPVGHGFCRVVSLSTENKNSSITNYYQLTPGSISLQCMLSVLSSVMEEPCFNILRTKEGLGYFVSAHEYDTYGISGFGVTVNSSSNDFDCTFVEQRIENFLRQMVDIISNMNPQKFRDHVISLITAKRAPDLKLSDEFNRYWNEIVSFNYCFDRLTKEIKCLEKITFDEFKDWACNQILGNSANKRKLSIQVVGYGKKSLDECLTFDGKPVTMMNDDSGDSEESPQKIKKFRLTYLKAKNTDKNDNFIDDINKYKRNLFIFPVHKVID
ncbi:nardilysin-like [Oppia nitens]|uniref:nardilysin-like n=1 Tax=Oppia nitens TaxID=1686743 RepID=UPI0023D9E27D|nr:nardilysin-like [Oppia nitens]